MNESITSIMNGIDECEKPFLLLKLMDNYPFVLIKSNIQITGQIDIDRKPFVYKYPNKN